MARSAWIVISVTYAVILVLGSVTPLLAQQPELPPEVVAIRKNAEQLVSGEYTATGTLTVEFRKVDPPQRRSREEMRQRFKEPFEQVGQQQKLENDGRLAKQDDGFEQTPPVVEINEYREVLHSAFDYEAQKLAFRRSRQPIVESRLSSFDLPNEIAVISTPEHTIRRRDFSSDTTWRVEIDSPVALPAQSKDLYPQGTLQQIFDARSMGWHGLYELGVHFDTEFLSGFDPKTISVTDEEKGMRRIEALRPLDAPMPAILFTWWLDKAQGFQPVRFERNSRYLDPTPFQSAMDQRRKPNETSKLSWDRVDGVWVLKSLEMHSTQFGMIGSEARLQLQFDWKSVNQPISDDKFDWRSWNIPPESGVYDVRNDKSKPLLVERIALPNPEPQRNESAKHSTDRVAAAPEVENSLGHTLVKQPEYQAKPKYCLMTFGERSDERVWMVEDGRRLFVDKNANGDLTDDGPPIEPSNVRHLDAERWDFEYMLDAITPPSESRHTKFSLSRWSYTKGEENYGLSLSVNDSMPMYAGWFGTFWSTTPEKAPVIHFGGPFTPKLLRQKEFTTGQKKQRLSLCFFNPGSGEGAVSRLSIAAIPESAVPKVKVEWPTERGDTPLRTTYELDQRCCYWEFYTSEFVVPEGVVEGKAKVSIELSTGTDHIQLTTTEISAPVVAQPVP